MRLFIITKGSGSITAGGKDYGVNVGNVLAVTPETEVKIQGNAQDFFYYIRLCSCGAQVEECVREAGLAGGTAPLFCRLSGGTDKDSQRYA